MNSLYKINGVYQPRNTKNGYMNSSFGYEVVNPRKEVFSKFTNCHQNSVDVVEDCKEHDKKAKVKYTWKQILRILAIFLIPAIAFSLAAIFNATKDATEPPEHLEFAITILIYALVVSAWSMYSFIHLNILIFEEDVWMPRSKHDKAALLINISAVFEILILTFYAQTLLYYAIYLFDNSQYVDTLVTRSASLVDVGTSHLFILFTFSHYALFTMFGSGIVFHVGVKFWSMLAAMVGVFWYISMTISILASVGSIQTERREKVRSKEEV